MHEAGHAVTGRVAMKRAVRAVVYDDNVGVAYLAIDGAIPRRFEEAVAVAAGPAAEALADLHTPPEESPPSPPLAATHPHAVAPLVAQLRQSPSDAAAIAQWCIRGIENEPERWTKRFYWIHREAQIFVARHRREIVDVATGLFTCGIVTLPARPGSKVAQVE
jgi:hypothetical protein